MKHPDLNKAMELRQLADQLERKVRSEADEAQKNIVPQWEYSVHVDGERDGVTTYRVNARLLNYADYKAHFDYYGTLNGDWLDLKDRSRVSVAYMRTVEGILAHTGGGWLLAPNGPRLISAEDWEAFTKGDVSKLGIK